MLKGETSPLSSILPNVPRLLYFQSLTPYDGTDGIRSLFLITLPPRKKRGHSPPLCRCLNHCTQYITATFPDFCTPSSSSSSTPVPGFPKNLARLSARLLRPPPRCPGCEPNANTGRCARGCQHARELPPSSPNRSCS